uniref:WRKY domain-containing protein n=1 Tax=Kalanchoe fedtschenkoi TaxID=63787 RepID=A0A7N0U3B3_KALFE
MSLRNGQQSLSSSTTKIKITRAIEDELNAGHKSALLLRHCLLHADSISIDDNETQGRRILPELLEKIILSFENSIAKLDDSQDHHQKSEEEVSAKWEEDSGESCKRRASQRKGRRGCYKRRKGSQSWTKLVPALVDDGQAWRKYGQKTILNSPFPRSYFRCAHKTNQGCLATKQVQQSRSEPPLYSVTYDGHHTCTHYLKSPSLFVADSTADHPSVLLSFSNPAESSDQYPPGRPLFGSPPSSDYMLSPESFAAAFDQGMASNASSNCSDLEGMEFMNHHEVGVGMCATDFDDLMKLEEFD